MLRRILITLVLTLMVSAGFVVGRASAAQPEMQAALTNLREARANLDRATNDKGGHRNKAVRLVNDAIVEVEAGMRFDRRH
ncbi:MAG TPA: hypothetical protein VGR02_01265 [Thermoanaerobaculia bacterium]|jgi:hypothetical protein|nr:hypothetical protein [Thermoanaerobaculia bacterium]